MILDDYQIAIERVYEGCQMVILFYILLTTFAFSEYFLK